MKRFPSSLNAFLVLTLITPSFAGTITVNESISGSSNLSDCPSLVTIPKGTTGQVLERYVWPSGNYELQIKVQLASPPAPAEKLWVYYAKNPKPSDQYFQLYDDHGAKTNELATSGRTYWAKALRTINVPKKESQKGASLEQKCKANEVTPASVTAMTEILKKAQAHSVPTLNPSEDEIASYLNSSTQQEAIAKLNEKKRSPSQVTAIQKKIASDLAENREIARTILNECAKANPKVPVALVLAIIKQESHFKPKALNPSSKASGLMQVMPSNLRACAKSGLSQNEANLNCGVGLLSTFIAKYGQPFDQDGNIIRPSVKDLGKSSSFNRNDLSPLDKILMSNDWGPGKLEGWINQTGKYKNVVPGKETKNYVSEFVATYGQYYAVSQATGVNLAYNP
jgi:hypothetical protein